MIRLVIASAVLLSVSTNANAQQKLPADHWLNGGSLLNRDDIRLAYEGLANVLQSEASQKFARKNFTKNAYYWVRAEEFDGTIGNWKLSQFDGQQFHVFADGTRYNFEVVKAWKGPLEVPLTTDSGNRRKSYGELRVDEIPAGTWKHRKGVRK